MGSLDLLRGGAVGLVMLRHAWPSRFGGAGIVGVTIFFALSGFLISGLIERDFAKAGHLSFGNFYRNRALRLLPALACLLVAFSAIELLFSPMHQRGRVVPTVLAALFYVADVPGIPMASGMTHLWTLAVEEQFYLVWPMALILALRRRRVGLLLSFGAVAWLIACCVTLILAPRGPEQVYELPTTWVEILLAGAALHHFRHKLRRMPGWAVVVACLALASMSILPDLKDRAETYLLGGPVVAVATCVLILFALDKDRVSRPLQPLRLLGIISYATYLWNYILVTWLNAVLSSPTLAAWLSIPATLAAASVSWLLVERPALSWKRRLDLRGTHVVMQA